MGHCANRAYPGPARAPWVPGVPGTTVVVVPGGCGWVVGVWEVAAPLGPRSESGKTKKGWVPDRSPVRRGREAVCAWRWGIARIERTRAPPAPRGYRVSPARRWSGGFLNSGVVVGGCFRSLGFARDDSRRARDDIGGFGWTVNPPRSPAPHRGYRVSPVRRIEGWVPDRVRQDEEVRGYRIGVRQIGEGGYRGGVRRGGRGRG